LNFFSLFKRRIIYNLKKKKVIDETESNTKSLDQLFQYYGSDKGNFFKKGKTKGHGYSSFYVKHLDKIKNKKINILEIGSYAGGSAAAFIKYFPNANVYCFDLNISNFEYVSKKIKVFGIDINNEIKINKTLNSIFEEHKFNSFDLIIDDASHNLKEILSSLKFFFKYLQVGGTFIIEDFKQPNYYEYNRNINHILVDEFLKNVKNRKLSISSIFNENDQKYLMETINEIEIHKGNLRDSDICFIKKNN
jgi:predicted O-methyltransferase YrrM